MTWKEGLQIARELGKIRISLPVSLSALAGFFLYNGSAGWEALPLALGVLLMSCGSATLNHIQEYRIDQMMSRTKSRPLPSNRITLAGAWGFALGYMISGSLLLGIWFHPAALILAWVTLFWYNLIYTPLKKVTAFAVVPGSVTGALPPVIGWTAAGGGIWDLEILLVAAFFFIGQIPHFWLLLLMFGEQYGEAGLPTLNKVFSRLQIKRISFVWIMTTVASAFLIMGYVIFNPWLRLVLLVYILFMLYSLVRRFFFQDEFKPLAPFYWLNFLYLLMMFLLMAEGWLTH